MGTPAMTRSRDRKRRSSSGDGGLVTPGIVVEVRGPPGIKRGGACSGHRLDRIPPGDARLVSAPLYGRCLLVEANLARAAVVPDRRTGSNLRLTGDIVKRFGIRSRSRAYLICTRCTSLKTLVMEGGRERLVEEQHLLDRKHVAHEEPARRHAGKPDDPKAVVRRGLLGAVLHRPERMGAPCLVGGC